MTVNFHPNSREALTFSGARDVMRSPRYEYSALKFGAHALYSGPFDSIKIMTDFGVGKTEETSNNEIKDRVNDVLAFSTQTQHPQNLLARLKNFLQNHFSKKPHTLFEAALEPWTTKTRKPSGVLQIDSFSDIPGGNVDYQGLSLLRLGGSKPNNNIFVHVADPGVGNTNDRSILVSKNHGIYIGPNNGSLSLLTARLEREGDTPKLYQIDLNKIQTLERHRLNDPTYRLPSTFHGRDVFGVAAALIASGVKPQALAVTQNNIVQEFAPVKSPFSDPAELPSGNKSTEVLALRDNTFGNLKLNLALSDTEFETLLASNKKVKLTTSKGDTLEIPVARKFSDVAVGEPVLYHGSSSGVVPGTRLLEIALNLENAADTLGVTPLKTEKFQLQLV